MAPQIVKYKGLAYDVVFTKLDSADYDGEVFYPVRNPRFWPKYDVYKDGNEVLVRVDHYSRSGNLLRRGTSQADEAVQYISANYLRIGGDFVPARIDKARIIACYDPLSTIYVDIAHLATYTHCNFELLPGNVLFVHGTIWSYLYQIVFVPSDSVLHDSCATCHSVDSIRILRDCGHAVCSGECYIVPCAICDEEYLSLSE